jgi:hypothetical protein
VKTDRKKTRIGKRFIGPPSSLPGDECKHPQRRLRPIVAHTTGYHGGDSLPGPR